MEVLVQVAMAFGLLPAVVASERRMTVDDAFAAQSSEASSFAFGTFDCTITGIEIILAGGEITYLWPHDWLHRDLFYGSAQAPYCPGLITMFEICLVRAGPYVELHIQPGPDGLGVEKAAQSVQKDSSIDFLEIVVLEGRFGIITGRFASVADNITCPNTITKSLDLLEFTESVWRTRMSCKLGMPTVDYVFRDENRRMSPLAHNEQVAKRTTSKTAQNADWTMLQDFGVSSSVVERLMQKMTTSQATTMMWLFPVLSPEAMGRWLRHGIDCAFYYGLDLFGSKAFYYDNMCLDTDIESETDPQAWRFLDGKTPCKRGTVRRGTIV